MLASWQGEAGQSDHGVAAPVAEPVIAGDDGFLVATGNDVLVGGIGKILGEGILDRRRYSYIPSTGDFCLPIFSHLCNIVLVSGGNHRGWTSKAEVETQNQGVEEVLREIEPPFAFDVIFKVPVPVPHLPQFGSIVGQEQRRQSLIRSDTRQSRTLLDRGIDCTVLVGGAVIVAERDQRPQFKPQFLWPFRMVVLLQFVLHDRAVFTVDHENRLLDLDALDFVGEDRKWVEPKLFEVLETLWVNDARVLVCRKIKRLPLDKERLFQLGKHHNTPNRWFSSSHQ